MPTYRYHLDVRDQSVYPCVLMPDGRWWSTTNLAWNGGINYPVNGDPSNTAKHGLLYDVAMAGIMPSGTHAPTTSEQNALFAALGGESVAGKMLRSVEYGGSDDYGFAWLCSGFKEAYGGYFYFDNVATMAISGGNYLYSSAGGDSAGGEGAAPGSAFSVRFIVDVFNEPPPYKLFGCYFQGFDRDATVTITRQIQIQESEGGSVTLIPTAPAQFDSWDIEVGLRVSAAQAQAIEASLPPYGTPSENALRLPPRGGGASFPGLLPLTPGETYDLYAYPMASPLDVQGRVAIGTDLFSYRMSLRFFAAHRVDSNTPTASSTTAPEWLTGKAITHSVVDPSASIPTIQQATTGSKPLPAALNYNFHPTKQGRTRKLHIPPDCLSQDRADELVGFFRGVRHNPTTITLDNGASGFEAVSVYLTALSFTRGDGLYWTGSLEVVLA